MTEDPRPSFLVRAAAELTPDQRAAIQALDGEAFAGHPFTGVYTWARDEHHVLAMDEHDLVGHCAMLRREASQAGAPLRLGGIGTVMTRPTLRGRGIAGSVLDVAERFLFETLEVDVGLLFCIPSIVPYYERRGWRVMRAAVMVDQPGGKIVWPSPVMLLAGARRSASPDATIDLCGLPW